MTHNRRTRRTALRNAPHAALARSCKPILESLEPRQLLAATLTRVSVATDGTVPTAQSGYGVISADANWVAFQSTDDTLVPGDGNGVTDVFLRDLRNNTTIRISNGHDGSQPDQNSTDPAISADGRYVAFLSSASNLVAGDTNGEADVFLYDRVGGTTRRVSVSSGSAAQADSSSGPPAISADGNLVVYHSNASNLVADDTNEFSDVFLYDAGADTTTLVSRNSGSLGNGASYNPAISANGQIVAFVSNASNFVAAGGDTNNLADVFVHDRNNPSSLQRVSVKNDGAQSAAGGAGQRVALSGDGRYVAFESDSADLVTGDNNAKTDIFLRDRQNNTTTRASVPTGGSGSGNGESRFPSLSSDGRYTIFESDATNLVASDTNAKTDVFIYDRVANTTRRVSTRPDTNDQANDDSLYPSMSSDGKYFAFFSKANNLIANDQNGVGDIFALVAPNAVLSGTPDGNNPVDIAAGDNSPASPDGTSYGQVDIAAAPVVRTFTIRNTGTAPLVLSGTVVTVTGTHAADFTVSQPSAGSLAYGESATFTVTFDPSTPGRRSARVNVVTSDPDTPTYSFDVAGAALDASNVSRLRITRNGSTVANATTLTIGNVPFSSSHTVYTFTVTNVSADTLTLASVTLDPATGFTIDTPLGATTLEPGQETTFSIRIPASSPAGVKSATVKLSNTSGDSVTRDLSFNITATVVVPKITITQSGSTLASGGTVAFGNVVKGSSSTSKSFTIRNDGQGNLVLGTITPPAGYAITNSPSTTIAPGQTTTLTIQLSSASAAGAKNGALTIVTNDPDVPTFTLNLTGAVTIAKVTVTYNGAAFAKGGSIAFGSAALSQTVPTRSITITNNGDATLNIGQITAPTGFSVTNGTTARTLGPGQSVDITFRPTTTSIGTPSGNLSFSTNDPDTGTFTAALSGKVIAHPLALLVDGVAATGPAVPFGTLAQGNTAVTKTLTIRNDGAVTITLGQPELPAGFTGSNLSATSLAPGASATMTVSFTPRVSGSHSEVVSMTSSETVRPVYQLGVTASVTPATRTALAVDAVSLGKVPPLILGGTPAATGAALVTLNNYSAATIAGKYKITLYASKSPFVEPGDKVLGTLNVNVNLKPKSKIIHTVGLKYPAPPTDGKYHVIAVVTGAKVDPVYAQNRALYTVHLEKPQAKIGQTGTAPKLSSKVGEKVTQTVTLNNTGNSAVSGTAVGDVYLSKSGTLTGAIKVGKVSGLKVNINNKGTQKVTFSVTLPKNLTGGYANKGTYTLLLNLTKVTGNVTTTFTADGLVNAGKVTLK